MADLSDIDTTNVGFIGYWNAIDQGGVSSIDPSEVTSWGNITSYTLYDNGIEGKAEIRVGTHTDAGDRYREVHFRVKNDGWVVAWLDREFDPATNTGPWDILKGWATQYSVSNISANTLETAIEQMKNQFSNSGSMTYTRGDVGLYNYNYSSATTVTNLRWDAGNPGGTLTAEFSYTSGTTRHLQVLTGAIGSDGGNGGDMHAGSTTSDPKFCGTGSFGVYDALGNGIYPNSGTVYGVTYNFTGNGGYEPSVAHENLILWS